MPSGNGAIASENGDEGEEEDEFEDSSTSTWSTVSTTVYFYEPPEDGDATLLIIACGAVLFVLAVASILILYYCCCRRLLSQRIKSLQPADSPDSPSSAASTYSAQTIPTTQKAVDHSGPSTPEAPRNVKSTIQASRKSKVNQSRGRNKVKYLQHATKSSSGSRGLKSSAPASYLLMDKVTITPEMFEKSPKKEVLFFKAASFNE